MANEKVFVKQSFTPMLKGVELVPPDIKIVSWSDGTDEEIAALLDAHYAGLVNLHEIWNVGDTRTVHLSAMKAVDVGETHVEQDVEFEIVNKGGHELVNGGECAFIVQQKACLSEPGYMNPTNTNSYGWYGSKRRLWCGDTYYKSIPESTRSLFKKFKFKTLFNTKNELIRDYEDFFSLPCAINIIGLEAVNSLWYYLKNEDTIQWEKYIDQKNRNKKDRSWWLRSAGPKDSTQNFYIVQRNGTLTTIGASSVIPYIAPFGCI